MIHETNHYGDDEGTARRVAERVNREQKVENKKTASKKKVKND